MDIGQAKGKTMKRPLIALFLSFLASVSAWASEESEHGEAHESDGFHVDSVRTWWWRDFLPDEEDAKTLGIEIDASFSVGNYNVKNINYFEVADFPVSIPGRPVGIGGRAGQREIFPRPQLRL
jgi:hypothetical protein